MVASDTLVVELRQVLNHLYDPTYLAQSPMVDALGLCTRLSPPLALQSTIMEAIKGIRSGREQPEQSRARRYYQVLTYRYVQQFTQADVANRMGISSRHLRREQDAAIHALAVQLASRYGMSSWPKSTASISENAPITPVTETGALPRGRPADVSEVITQALGLVSGLAQRYGVNLEMQAQEDRVAASIPKTVLKPVLLDVLSSAIRAVPEGVISLGAAEEEGQVVITIRAEASTAVASAGAWETGELVVAADLARAHGGELALDGCKHGLVARLMLPKAADVYLLAIEDNRDALQLWARYLAGTPYRLVGEQDPLKAVERATRLEPAAIVLDVMLPGMDGWELLGRLQYHPTTRDIPVVVCTIHPQRELALSLGATAFVRKPTSRRAFLAALDACI